ncbi:MAG: thiamine pyrophosphate-binding protein [Deltaproteobacteria bacterium]|nr:thiamine pyrophosphate-binding protein [Deltaproteobacteria bacterium]
MAKPDPRIEKKQAEFGSDIVVDLMKAFDIEYAAFIPGASFRGIHDSIVNYGGNFKPEIIFCHHEEISVAVAHGYAKAKGKPMVAIVHNIVGLQHATMAVFNAWCDRVPLILLGGAGPMAANRRRPWIDWIHTAQVQANQIREYVKWDDQPTNLESVPESFIRGYRIATTEPTAPIYISYDADLQEDKIREAIELPDVSRFAVPAPLQASRESLDRAAQLLVEAQSPIIIADAMGRNPGAVSHLVELAELLAIPVIDKGRRFNFPNDNSLDITGAAQNFIKKADVVMGLDVLDLFGSLTTIDRTTRVSTPVTLPSVKVIDISLRDMLVRSWAADYQPLQEVDVPISADTSVAVPELIKLCRERMSKETNLKSRIEARFNEVRKVHDESRAKWQEQARGSAGQQTITVAYLAHELGEVIKNEDWVLVNGNLNGWARRLWDWNKPNQFLGPSGGAGLGYGMGAAVGAALAHKDSGKLCVNIQADGDLMMTPSALWTAAHHKIPLLTVMYNNQSYYNSEDHAISMAKSRGRPVENAGIGTHVDNPPVSFAKMAESFGVYGEGPVLRPGDLRPALERVFKVVKERKLPAVLDVISEAR